MLEGKVTGNPEGRRSEELHERAWGIVQPHFQGAQDAAAQYRQLAGTGHVAADIEAVVTAAHDGWVETLFVAVDRQEWGIFHAETRTVETHQDALAGDDDLLDVAAMHTLLKRGTVYAVGIEQMPAPSPTVAILRY